MKKKFTYFVAAVCAALTFSACSSDKLEAYSGQTLENPESPSNAISFGTYMGKTGTTRAYSGGQIGNETNTTQGITSLKDEGVNFGVFAYYTGTKDYRGYDTNAFDWANASGTSWKKTETNKYPNFMYNEKIYWSSDKSQWIYDVVKYWPNGTDAANTAPTLSNTALQKDEAKLSFFAFAPYTTATTTGYSGTVPSGVEASNVLTNTNTSGIQAITSNTSNSNVWVKYLMPDANANTAVDLLWGVRGAYQYKEADNTNNPSSALTSLDGITYNENLTKQIVKESSATERVSFLFKHALAKFSGQLVTGDESATETPGSETQIGFKVVVDIDKNSATPETVGQSDQTTYFTNDFSEAKTLVTLKSVKIQDGKTAYDDRANNGIASDASAITSNLNNAGWFNIEEGVWSNGSVETTGASYNVQGSNATSNDENTTDANYSLNPDIKEPATGVTTSLLAEDASDTYNPKKWNGTGGDNSPKGVTLTAKPVFAKENIPGLLLIPSGDDTGNDIYITVDYLVRTVDTKLAAGFTQVEQVITNKVSLASLRPNKFYTIIMHIGLTSVKFEAVVADWANTVGGTYDENGHYTPGSDTDATEEREVIWLPSNVITTTP